MAREHMLLYFKLGVLLSIHIQRDDAQVELDMKPANQRMFERYDVVDLMLSPC